VNCGGGARPPPRPALTRVRGERARVRDAFVRSRLRPPRSTSPARATTRRRGPARASPATCSRRRYAGAPRTTAGAPARGATPR